MSEKAILKRKEREERKARGKLGSFEPDQNIATPFAPESIPGTVESSRTTPSHTSDATVARNSTTPYTVHVPGASSPFEWYSPSAHSFTTLAAARNAGIWDYPATPAQRARCAVFRDLWEQGYFMGGGIKFGGEYLVYPGTFVLLVYLLPIAPRHRLIFRGPITIPFPLCRIRNRVSCSPPSTNGDRRPRSARNWHEKGSLVMRVGRGQAGRDILFHRVGGIRLRSVRLHEQRTRSVRPNYPSHTADVRKWYCIANSLADG